MKCPKCDEEIIMASVENPRNGKWTLLPLDKTPDAMDSFILSEDEHEAVDILGNSLGNHPIAILVASDGQYGPHSPSHFLET
jgi:hypothetical protein